MLVLLYSKNLRRSVFSVCVFRFDTLVSLFTCFRGQTLFVLRCYTYWGGTPPVSSLSVFFDRILRAHSLQTGLPACLNLVLCHAKHDPVCIIIIQKVGMRSMAIFDHGNFLVKSCYHASDHPNVYSMRSQSFQT